MRKYRSNQRFKASFGMIDLLFNLLIGFVFLFIVAFIMIRPIAKTKIVDPKAEFLIIMTWPDGDENDIDLWVKAEKSNTVSFRAKDSGLMHLDRDDLGGSNDTVIIDGKPVKSKINREVVSIRQKIQDKYYVNVHWYSQKGANSITEDIKVEVILLRVNPYREVAKSTVILPTKGAEGSAFQFHIGEDGEIEQVTKDDERWVMGEVQAYIDNAGSAMDSHMGTERGNGP